MAQARTSDRPSHSRLPMVDFMVSATLCPPTLMKFSFKPDYLNKANMICRHYWRPSPNHAKGSVVQLLLG